MSGLDVRSLRLPSTARSTMEARHFVVETVESWGFADLADTAALLTSEVVTNAVLHARTELLVDVRRVDAGVEVAVTDGSSRGLVRRQTTADATTGRGMGLLDVLASDWSVTSRSDGKTVAFTVLEGADPWAAWADGELGREGRQA